MIKNWIILTAFFALIGFVVNSLLPNGKMKQVTALIFSIISIITILQPIKEIADLDYDFNFDKPSNSYLEENSFSNYLDNYYLNLAQSNLKNSGIDLKAACFEFDDKNGQNSLKNIYINSSDLVIIGGYEHINITMITKQNLSYLFLIPKENVVINENG